MNIDDSIRKLIENNGYRILYIGELEFENSKHPALLAQNEVDKKYSTGSNLYVTLFSTAFDEPDVQMEGIFFEGELKLTDDVYGEKLFRLFLIGKDNGKSIIGNIYSKGIYPSTIGLFEFNSYSP